MADRPIVLSGGFDLGEYVLYPTAAPFWIDVGVTARVVEPGHHFLDSLGNDKGVCFAGGLVDV